jgi:hypothetical protein
MSLRIAERMSRHSASEAVQRLCRLLNQELDAGDKLSEKKWMADSVGRQLDETYRFIGMIEGVRGMLWADEQSLRQTGEDSSDGHSQRADAIILIVYNDASVRTVTVEGKKVDDLRSAWAQANFQAGFAIACNAPIGDRQSFQRAKNNTHRPTGEGPEWAAFCVFLQAEYGGQGNVQGTLAQDTWLNVQQASGTDVTPLVILYDPHASGKIIRYCGHLYL